MVNVESPYHGFMTTTLTDVKSLIREELDRLVDLRRDLHAHPELGYEEHRTSEVVQRELSDANVEFRAELAGGTGVLGHLAGEADGATGLRADMDALPIVEATGLPYASTRPGVMHACGHDGHTTILVGAARVLSRLAERHGLPRPVTFAFQPAEEGGAGGRRMVEDGCLDGSVIGPPVQHMFGLHGWPEYELGTIGSRPGPMLAAADKFELTVAGTGAHAAYPHFGRDPIVAASAIVAALQTLPSRNVDPLDSIVVSVTQFHGGTTHNVIPSHVELAGTVRTLTPETRELAQERMREIAEGTARAHGCTADLRYELGYPVTLNDPGMVDLVHSIGAEAVGAEQVVPLEAPVMGGEDFSFYSHKVPSCFFALGLRPVGRETIPNVHQPTFDFNDDALALGVEMFCRLALR
jgi:hippurate hydrolase